MRLQHVWQCDLETHLRETSSSSGRPSGPHPVEMEGAAGGGRSPFDPCSREHQAYTSSISCLGKAAFWNPSVHSSQWHHQRHVWDKSMQQEESGNQWLLFKIRDSAFVIKILKNKVLERMKSHILHKYLHQKKNINKWREILSSHRADVHPLRCPLIIYSVISFWELTGQKPDEVWF